MQESLEPFIQAHLSCTIPAATLLYCTLPCNDLNQHRLFNFLQENILFHFTFQIKNGIVL